MYNAYTSSFRGNIFSTTQKEEVASYQPIFFLIFKESWTLMTSLYKENAQSWDTCISVLTFPVLIWSKKVFIRPIFMIQKSQSN